MDLLKALERVTSSIKAWTNIELNKINNRIDDISYKEIEIINFSNNIMIAEFGATINNVLFNWELNKIPSSQTLNEAPIDVVGTSYIYSLNNLGLQSDTTFFLNVTDEHGTVASGKTSITFVNGIYYGIIPNNVSIDNTIVLGLIKELPSEKSVTFTVTTNSGEYIVCAVPSNQTSTFSVDGFNGGFYKATTIEFTNSEKYTESYDIWLSDNDNLGKITVTATWV